MSDYLPFNLLGWLPVGIDEILNTPDDAKIGYAVEVDIEIPREIHEKLKDYPPCPEVMSVKTEWLSDYQKDILKLNKSNHAQSSKLILNLFNKEKYICHYRYLKFIKSLGCIITKVHRVLAFEQSQWMKPYIDLNTRFYKRGEK